MHAKHSRNHDILVEARISDIHNMYCYKHCDFSNMIWEQSLWVYDYK